jgi:hypothetical protein
MERAIACNQATTRTEWMSPDQRDNPINMRKDPTFNRQQALNDEKVKVMIMLFHVRFYFDIETCKQNASQGFPCEEKCSLR